MTNLLDMNRLQTGAVKPLDRPTVIEEVVQRAIGGLPLSAVVSEVGEDLPLFTQTPRCWSESFANVIENAARQASGGVPVRVLAGDFRTRAARGYSRCRSRARVPVSQRSEIFEPFLRSGDHKHAQAGESVLGLQWRLDSRSSSARKLMSRIRREEA